MKETAKAETPTRSTSDCAPSRPSITYQAISALQPDARNPRTHSQRQIRQIADSIRAFGFTNPILVDEKGSVMAGHGRLEAAKLLGIRQVPTIRIGDLTEAQKRAYVIADNKLAENAGWDSELLTEELRFLTDLTLGFDVTLTGFETAEIDLLLDEARSGEETDPADKLPAIDDAPPVSRIGDLWRLGAHRLLCADARDPSAFERLLGGEKAGLVFTDPPYNVPIRGNVCGRGQARHGEFVMASGEMSERAYTDFLGKAFRNLAEHSRDGSIHYVCMDWRHLGEVLAAGQSVYSELKNLCVWSKTNGGMGSLYRSRHELVFVFKHGAAPHINNIELGRHGRNRTNVWEYAGVNAWGPDRLDDLALHPTVKPVAMIADAIRDCSRRGGIVLDGFAGSGSTLIAAERTGPARVRPRAGPKVRRRRHRALRAADRSLCGSRCQRDDLRPDPAKPPVDRHLPTKCNGFMTMAGEYEVGYRRPPKTTRFKPGQSGNPKGRPAKARNFKSDVKKTLETPIRLVKDGKPQTVSTQEGLLLRLREKALKGDARSLDLLLELAQAYNAEELATAADDVLGASDQEILENYLERVLRQGTNAEANEPEEPGDA